MRPSPLQLNELFFEKVLIEADSSFRDAKLTGTDLENTSEFEGVTLVSGIESFPTNADATDKRDFFVRLKFGIPNEGGKLCRYKIDIEVVGAFTVVADKVPVDDRENFVVVNGATLLYGAIREQVASISARSLPGQMLLPTVNFLDLKKPAAEKKLPGATPN